MNDANQKYNIEIKGIGSKEYGSLVNWESGKFVPIVDMRTGRTFYGGHQRWLIEEGVSKFYSDRSCGVTAIANMLVYMAQNPENGPVPIEKSTFSAFQRNVYVLVLPMIWGVPTVNTLVKRVQKYSLLRGLSLKAVKFRKPWSEANVRAFIAKGLNLNSPVLLITWNSVIPDLTLHWVTVTRLFEDETGTKMVTSNWGNQQIFDFSAWVNGPSIYKDVVYFE